MIMTAGTSLVRVSCDTIAMTGVTEDLLDVRQAAPRVSNDSLPSSTISYVDSRKPWRQWMACLSATLSMVAVGTVYGWTTTVLARLIRGDDDVPLKITADQSSWIVALTVLGSMIGPFIGAFLADMVGRKRGLLVSSIFYVTGWALIVVTDNVSVIYVSRVILGIGVGISYTINPLYVSEVADIKVRGALGTLIALNVFTGSLLACSAGPYLSYTHLGLVMLCVPILFVFTFIWFPESPHYLAARGKRAEAANALAFFKGITDRAEARKQLELAIRNTCGTQLRSPSSDDVTVTRKHWHEKWRQLFQGNNHKAILIVASLICSQQMSGNFSTMQYLGILFQRPEISMDANLATVIVLLVGFISSTMATAFVEKLGRRCLLMWSTLGSTIALYAVAIMLGITGNPYLKLHTTIPVIAVVCFQLFYQMGLGSLPNAFIGELFPTDVKGMAGGFLTLVDGVMGFFISKLYQIGSHAFGIHVVYYIFGTITFVAFGVVCCCVPETSGRTFSEIQTMLETNDFGTPKRKAAQSTTTENIESC